MSHDTLAYHLKSVCDADVIDALPRLYPIWATLIDVEDITASYGRWSWSPPTATVWLVTSTTLAHVDMWSIPDAEVTGSEHPHPWAPVIKSAWARPLATARNLQFSHFAAGEHCRFADPRLTFDSGVVIELPAAPSEVTSADQAIRWDMFLAAVRAASPLLTVELIHPWGITPL